MVGKIRHGAGLLDVLGQQVLAANKVLDVVALLAHLILHVQLQQASIRKIDIHVTFYHTEKKNAEKVRTVAAWD